MIKLQMRDVVNMREGLQELLALDAPLKAALQVMKIARILRAELGDFNEAIAKVRSRLGEEKDGVVTVKPENMPEFNKAVEDALDVDVELDVDPLKMEAFGEKLVIKPGTLLAINKLLAE